METIGDSLVSTEQTRTDQGATGTPKLIVGGYEFKFDSDGLDDFYIKKARDELRESPEVVAEALETLRSLIQEEPELVVPDENDFYQKFLRPCKWYPKPAFELMKRFYHFHSRYPGISNDLLPSQEELVLSAGVLVPLPLRTKDGCRIVILNCGSAWNPKLFNLYEFFKCTVLTLLTFLSEPKTQVAGIRVICDIEGLSLSQVSYYTPAFAGMVAEWVQKCLPGRLKGIHIVNQPYIFNMVFAFFKPFLQQKTRKRIHFHGTDRASLHSHIEASVLPTKLGGVLDLENGSSADTLWRYFSTLDKLFEATNNYGYIRNS